MAGPVRRLTLESGLERLEQWSADADQTERNLAYEALFSIVEGSVFWAYPTVVDPDGDLSVHIRPELVLRIRLTDDGRFSVLSIGSGVLAQDRDLDGDRPA